MTLQIWDSILVMVLGLSLVSCVSPGPIFDGPLAAPERDAKAKTFAAKPDKSVVFIYRPDFDLYTRIGVSVDGYETADIVARSYIRLELTPGPHEFASKTKKGSSKLPLVTEAGRLYFISHGWGMARNPLGLPFLNSRDPANLFIHLLPESNGRADVQRLRMFDTPMSTP
jgi:hypothetical protein